MRRKSMTCFLIIALLVPDLSWCRPAGEKYLRPPHQENLNLTVDRHGQLLELTANFIGGEPGKRFLVDLIGNFQSIVRKIEATDRTEEKIIIK
ncbi:MAG: hypothetical protein ABII74_07060 [Elusimicrobiota bacterium]